MQKLDQFFINGRWVKAMGEGRHPVVDPATEEVIGHIAMANASDVNATVAAARAAFDQGALWTALTGAALMAAAVVVALRALRRA